MTGPNANNYKLHFAIPRDDLSPTQADTRTHDGRTPLMLAVLRNDPFHVNSHLSIDIDIDVVDNSGRSALQMAFSSKATGSQIIRKLLRIAQDRYRDDELTGKLFEAGCTLYHASFLRDVQVTQGLLQRGVRDVDWAGHMNMTALHVAAMSNYLPLISRLLDAGANVNALDALGRSALLMSAAYGNEKSVRLLLERGADPNARSTDFFDELTPFGATLRKDSRGSDECAEMLIRHGAVPSHGTRKLLDEALGSGRRKTNLLISYAALRELQGDTGITEMIMECDSDYCRANVSEYRIRYERCQRALRMTVFQGLSLLELLSASAAKFQSYTRMESFYGAIATFQMSMSGEPCVLILL